MKQTLLKFSLIAACCFFSHFSYGQTKEETIEWLKDKLSKYIDNDGIQNLKLVSIDECKFVFTYNTTNWSVIQTLPTDILKVGENGAIIYLAEVVKVDIKSDDGYANIVYHGQSTLKLSNREENIRIRVEKALKHLATFCPKKKETF